MLFQFTRSPRMKQTPLAKRLRRAWIMTLRWFGVPHAARAGESRAVPVRWWTAPLRAFWPRNFDWAFREPLRGSRTHGKIINSPEHQRWRYRQRRSRRTSQNENHLLPLDERKSRRSPSSAQCGGRAHWRLCPRAIHSVSILEGIRTRAGKTSRCSMRRAARSLRENRDGPDGMRTTRNWPRRRASSEYSRCRGDRSQGRRGDPGGWRNGEHESRGVVRNSPGRPRLLRASRRAERSRQGGRGNRRPDHRILINGRPLPSITPRNMCRQFGGVYPGQGWHGRRASPVRGRESRRQATITFPRSVGQLPDYYDYKPSRNRSYIFTSSGRSFILGWAQLHDIQV